MIEYKTLIGRCIDSVCMVSPSYSEDVKMSRFLAGFYKYNPSVKAEYPYLSIGEREERIYADIVSYFVDDIKTNSDFLGA